MGDESRTERWVDWLKRSPPLLIISVLVLLISAFVTITGFASDAWDYYDDRARWRDSEYDKIRQLRAGISIDRVAELLGSPLLTQKSADEVFTEKSFRGRDYWVQAVHDDVGTVVMVAITSCDLAFKPQIEGPLGTVVLNESHFDDLGDPYRLRYFVGNTANTFFFDEYYGGNPGFYKTYFLGINDACRATSDVSEGVEVAEGLKTTGGLVGDPDLPRNRRAAYDPSNTQLVEFRSRAIINTYAETDPAPRDFEVHADTILNAFQVGVDRIRTRTIDLPEQP